MSYADADGGHYTVPPEPSRWSAMMLAALVHAGLFFFLWYGVSWENDDPAAIVVEAWDLKVQNAAPPPTPRPEPVAEPEPVKPPKPVEREPEPPPVKAPDIALERIKEKRLLEQRKAELAKLEEQKKKQDLADKKLLEDKKLAEKKLKDQAKQTAAAEELAIKKIREEQMRRITGAGTTGEAAKSTGPRSDDGYYASIQAKIKPKIQYSVDPGMPGNPRAVYKITQLPTGEVIGYRKVKSSGVPAYDSAVEAAIDDASPLPKRKDGTVQREIEATFDMKEPR